MTSSNDNADSKINQEIEPAGKPSPGVVDVHGAEQELAFAGRYLDQLELRNGCWKIIHRQVVMDWSLRLDVQDERSGDAFGALAKGAGNRQDPAHALLPIY